jgi:hypothetical protein
MLTPDQEIQMRFEGRELKPFAEPVLSADLQEGSIYFSVNYVDDEMLIPVVEPLVFVGRNLEAEDVGRVYFQDVDSYNEGIRYASATEDQSADFYVGPENEVGHIFEFERALDQLLKCSLRRRES